MGVDVLVINLTRFGDLLQSQGVVDDLAASGKTVGLVCLENFAGAAGLMRGIARVWPFPGAGLLAETGRNWRLAAARLLEFCSTVLAEGAPGTALNLTPTLPARLLCRLLCQGGARPLGFSLDADGYGLNHGVWASFVAVAAANRQYAPFNLSDMLRKLAAPLCKPLAGSARLAEPAPESLEWADKFLREAAPADVAGFAAFQLGASEERRRWPVAHFHQLGRWLWREKRICPVLLGSADEKGLAREYAELAGSGGDPFIDAVGSTSLVQLAAVLRQCRFLATNDTGTMHLAAGLGVSGLGFFLATAQPWDTGPLLPGWCCLEPGLDCHPCAFGKPCGRNHACRGRISADTAIGLVNAWLQTGKWPAGAPARDDARVWVAGRTASGMARVFPLSGGGQRAIWMGALAEFWEHMLDALDGGEREPAYDSWALRSLPEAAETAAGLELAAGILASVEQSGPLAATPRGGKILLRNCERLQTALDQCPPLGSLAAFWREYRRGQDAGLDAFLASCNIMRAHLEKLRLALGGKPAGD